MSSYLAIDIGASSGRHILGRKEGDKLVLTEVYRFDNKQLRKNGHDCWDMENLKNGVLNGLKACREQGVIPQTVGIDTWGVDYLLLNEKGETISDAVAYRDSRTAGMDAVAEEILSSEELYARTGIQKQPYNTVYQLLAEKKENPARLQSAARLLMIPEYLNYLLTGVQMNEYTNASTTGLLNAAQKNWDTELIEKLGLPRKIFGKLELPGTVVGNFTAEVEKAVGFNAIVVLPATHDTGSAFLAVPARDDKAVYLSSGTWSLLGVENELPLTSAESRKANFTNEGGAFYRFRYLKNIMGLWMIQSVRRELNGVNYVSGKEQRTETEKKWSFAELEEAARNYKEKPAFIDVNKGCFLSPESMKGEIAAECKRTGQPVPDSVGALMACIYHSLSECYKNAVKELSALTGKTYTSLNIVGGGGKDGYLAELTAEKTGLAVFTGPSEGTAIGNLILQMIAAKELKDLADARAAIRRSFEIKEIAQ